MRGSNCATTASDEDGSQGRRTSEQKYSTAPPALPPASINEYGEVVEEALPEKSETLCDEDSSDHQSDCHDDNDDVEAAEREALEYGDAFEYGGGVRRDPGEAHETGDTFEQEKMSAFRRFSLSVFGDQRRERRSTGEHARSREYHSGANRRSTVFLGVLNENGCAFD